MFLQSASSCEGTIENSVQVQWLTYEVTRDVHKIGARDVLAVNVRLRHDVGHLEVDLLRWQFDWRDACLADWVCRH